MLIVWCAVIAVVLIILFITLATFRPELLDPLANTPATAALQTDINNASSTTRETTSANHKRSRRSINHRRGQPPCSKTSLPPDGYL